MEPKTMAIEDDIGKIFEKYHRAPQGSGSGAPQAQQSNHPVLQLAEIYDNWVYEGSFPKETSGISIDDVVKFDEIFPALQNQFEVKQRPDGYWKDGLAYLAFMFRWGEQFKSRGLTDPGERLPLPVESPSVLQLIRYLNQNATNARVRFENDHTMALWACDRVWLPKFSSGRLIIDCELKDRSPLTRVGDCMQGGDLILTSKVRVRELGYHMKGGTIHCLGDISNATIGEDMEGGEIIISGNVRDSDIARGMRGGTIRIEGDLSFGYRGGPNFGVAYDMTGGEVLIAGRCSVVKGERESDEKFGWSMKGGSLYIKRGVRGRADIGPNIESNAFISIEEGCEVESVGHGMSGGRIVVRGDAGKNIGYLMKGGVIDISGSIVQHGYNWAIGDSAFTP